MSDYVTRDHLELRLAEHRRDTDAAIDELRREIKTSMAFLATKEDVAKIDTHLSEQDERLYELKGQAGTRSLLWAAAGTGVLLAILKAVGVY